MAEPMRRLVLEYVLAIRAGDREKASRLVSAPDPATRSLFEATLSMDAAMANLLSAVRERMGEGAANTLLNEAAQSAYYDVRDRIGGDPLQRPLGRPSPDDAVERALSFFHAVERADGEGWILARRSEPGMPRVPELPAELTIARLGDEWRIALPPRPSLPSWRVGQLTELAARSASAVNDAAASVLAGTANDSQAVRGASLGGCLRVLNKWEQEVRTAVLDATADFGAQFEQIVDVQLAEVPVQEMAFEPGGRLLAVGLINTPDSLHVVELDTNQTRSLPISDEATERHVEALAFVGDRLVVGGAGFHRERVDAARREGRELFFGTAAVTDGTLRVVDPATGDVSATLTGHQGYTTDAVGVDGTLYTVGSDNVIRSWRIAGADPQLLWEHRFPQLGAPYGVAVAGDLVVASSRLGTVVFADRATGESRDMASVFGGLFTEALTSVAPDRIALGAVGKLFLLDLSRAVRMTDEEREEKGIGTRIQQLPHAQLAEDWLGFSRTNDLAAAPSRGLLVSGDGVVNQNSAVREPKHGPGVRFWIIDSGQWLGWLPRDRMVTSVALSLDAQLLAVADVKGRVSVYRLPERITPMQVDALGGE